MSIGRRRAAEASFGIGDSRAREIGLGAQPVSRAREALRPCGLFVSPGEASGVLSETQVRMEIFLVLVRRA
jgi:hypothetical protein